MDHKEINVMVPEYKIGHNINPIQQSLMASMFLMIEKFKEIDSLKNKSKELLKEADLLLEMSAKLDEKYNIKTLRKLGFSSASFSDKDNALKKKYDNNARLLIEEGYKYNKFYNIERNRIILINNMKEYWGEESLLVPFDDFEAICKKYNLICGLFEEYVGYVPNNKIAKIADIQRKLERGYGYWHNYGNEGIIKTIYRIVKVNKFADDELKRMADSIFPFCINDSFSIKKYTLSKGCQLFICAPKKYMKSSSKQLINYTDPFICAYTDFGIMILEKWDLEAEDEIIKNHKQEQTSLFNGITSFINRLLDH